MGLVGAGMIVIGAFCPAISAGEARSFFAIGNTVTAMLLGLAGATAWSIAKRQTASVVWNGGLSALIVATFGVAVWNDEIREPVRSFFGMIQSEIRFTSWILIGIGAALVSLAGYQSRNSDSQSAKPYKLVQLLAIAGMVLATFGCLFGIAMTNPFGPMSSGSLREVGRSWDDELNVVRWLLITGSVVGVVLSAQVPRLADRTLRFVVGITWWLVGNALFNMLSPQVSINLCFAIVWNLACFGLLLWKTNSQRSWIWWKRGVLWLPYLAVGMLLLVMGEFGDLIFAAGPAVVATTTGYLICRSSKCARGAAFAATLVLGIPATVMALGDIPNEYLEPCGLSLSEGRVLLLTWVGLLAWVAFLSFPTTWTGTPLREGETNLSPAKELKSGSDAPASGCGQ